MNVIAAQDATYALTILPLLFLLIAATMGVAAVVLAVAALLRLRRARVDEVARALWAAFVVLVPVFGPIAFLIVKPGSDA